jgi:hypothetical protein
MGSITHNGLLRSKDIHRFVVQITIAGIDVLEKSEVHQDEIDRAE